MKSFFDCDNFIYLQMTRRNYKFMTSKKNRYINY